VLAYLYSSLPQVLREHHRAELRHADIGAGVCNTMQLLRDYEESRAAARSAKPHRSSNIARLPGLHCVAVSNVSRAVVIGGHTRHGRSTTAITGRVPVAHRAAQRRAVVHAPW
jgi:hypothetical protein